MNVWWCNQSENWEAEYSAGVVRASDQISNPTFRMTVGEAKLGDIVVHYRTPNVVAFSRAEEDGRHESNLPSDYGSGWEFSTEYHVLDAPVDRDSFRHEIVVPAAVGFAFDTNHNVRQGYFFHFSTDGLAVVLANVSPEERLPSWLKNGEAPEPPPVEERDTRMRESGRFTWHLKRERNRKLAAEAKRIHGCACQVCGFDFEQVYGRVGAEYIEAHHVIPFHTLPEDDEVPLSPRNDFRVVCANCHRMLHRHPYPAIKKLRAVVKRRREGSGNDDIQHPA